MIITHPVWSLYNVFGYENMMIMLGQSPDLASHAAQRILENTLQHISMIAALGAAAVWIEECLTDMISPDAFARLNLPVLRELVETIRATGMHSIYYFCGNPTGKWELLLEAGADALSLEESKKGFTIDIEQVVRVCAKLMETGKIAVDEID